MSGEGWELLLHPWFGAAGLFVWWVWLLVAVSSLEDSGCGLNQPWLGPSQACAHQAAAMSKSLVWAGGLMGSLARSWLPQAMLWSSGSWGFPCGKDSDLGM